MVASTSYYHYDGLGSTSALTDSGQNITDTYTYNAFGEQVASTGTSVNPFRYVGELGYYYDADSANYYVRARTYRSLIIRWLSEDPIGVISGDANFYRYVSNDPATFVDPSGKQIGGAPIGPSPPRKPKPKPTPPPPKAPTPPPQADKYFVCSRDIRGEGALEQCGRDCGIHHVDIYSIKHGQIRNGGQGGVYGTFGTGLPTGEGWKCTELVRDNTSPGPGYWPVNVLFPVDNIVSWGTGAGKACRNATDTDILSCLRSKPGNTYRRLGFFTDNCQTDVQDAADGCCLSGFRGTSLRFPILFA